MSYIAAFLSIDHAKQELQNLSKGSVIQLIKKKDLEQLEIPIPSNEVLRKISSAYEIALKHKYLYHRASFLSGQIIESSFADRVF